MLKCMDKVIGELLLLLLLHGLERLHDGVVVVGHRYLCENESCLLGPCERSRQARETETGVFELWVKTMCSV